MSKILFLADVPNWAFQVTYEGIRKYMECDVLYTSADPRFSKSDLDKYDCIHSFNWLNAQDIAGHPKVSAGVCQHNFEIKWSDIAPKYISKFKKMVAISREIEEKIKKLNPNTTYIPNAVDHLRFKPFPHKGEFTVGWCSQKTSGGFGEGKKTSEGRKRYDIKRIFVIARTNP